MYGNEIPESNFQRTQIRFWRCRFSYRLGYSRFMTPARKPIQLSYVTSASVIQPWKPTAYISLQIRYTLLVQSIPDRFSSGDLAFFPLSIYDLLDIVVSL